MEQKDSVHFLIKMNFTDKIIPAKSLGGVKLGKTINNYLMEELMDKEITNDVIIYKNKRCFIEIFVNKTTKIIYKISALYGYKGLFDNYISVGNDAIKILNTYNDFFLDECEEGILSKEIKGIFIELDKEDPLIEELDKLKIEAITIFQEKSFPISYYNPNLSTVVSQEGVTTKKI